MKRLITSAVCFMFTLCLTACAVPTKGENSSCENNLGASFESDAVIVIDKLNADAELIHSDDGAWSVEFSSPNTLSGIKLEFADDKVNASYKGLDFSVPQSALPVKAMMLNLIQAVDELHLQFRQFLTDLFRLQQRHQEVALFRIDQSVVIRDRQCPPHQGTLAHSLVLRQSVHLY